MNQRASIVRVEQATGMSVYDFAATLLWESRNPGAGIWARTVAVGTFNGIELSSTLGDTISSIVRHYELMLATAPHKANPKDTADAIEYIATLDAAAPENIELEGLIREARMYLNPDEPRVPSGELKAAYLGIEQRNEEIGKLEEILRQVENALREISAARRHRSYSEHPPTESVDEFASRLQGIARKALDAHLPNSTEATPPVSLPSPPLSSIEPNPDTLDDQDLIAKQNRLISLLKRYERALIEIKSAYWPDRSAALWGTAVYYESAINRLRSTARNALDAAIATPISSPTEKGDGPTKQNEEREGILNSLMFIRADLRVLMTHSEKISKRIEVLIEEMK